MTIPLSLSKLTADDLKHNREIIKEYKLFNRKHQYRCLKSLYFDTPYLRQLDLHIERFLKSLPNYIVRGFNDLLEQEQYLLAATIFVPLDQHEDICNRIAAPLTAFDGGCVRKEAIRASLHFLTKISPAKGDTLTLRKLLGIIRQHVDDALAA